MGRSPIRFVFDGPPVGKARPRTDFISGRVHEDADNAKIERAIRSIAAAAYGARDPLTAPVRVTITSIKAVPASWPKRYHEAVANGALLFNDSKPDGDNIEKLIWDACSGLIWRDDCQVAEWAGRKRFGHPERTEVHIEPILDPIGAPVMPTPAQLAREKVAWADVLAQRKATKAKRKAAAQARREQDALSGRGGRGRRRGGFNGL